MDMLLIMSFIYITLILVLLIKVVTQRKINVKAKAYSKRLENQLFDMDKKCRRFLKINKKLELSQEIANIGTWNIQENVAVPYWSDEAYRIFGKNKDIFIPTYRNVINLFHVDDRKRINNEFVFSVKEKREFRAIGKIYHENGFVFHIEIKGQHTFDESLNRVQTTGIVRDVTQRIQMEDVLKQMNKNLDSRVEEELEKNKIQQRELFRQSRMAQLGEMLSMIAHQWRQPLGAISSISIDLNMKLEFEKFNLQKEKEQEECQLYFKKSLNDIGELIEGLSNTIDDFRNFYKPNKKTKKMRIDKPIEKALKIIKPSFITNSVKVIQHYDSFTELDVYEGELIQVILNILQNAQDNFRDKNISDGTIDIKTYDTNEYAILNIEDNGGGIDIDIIEKIFDPYYSTKDEKNGTGLGLYMSKIIINEHHSGTIEAYNTKDGVCFTIRLKNEGVSK